MKIHARGVRGAAVVAAAAVGLTLGSTGISSAAVDDQNSINSNGLEVVVSQEDTFLQGVPPIGGSPLSREWFHNGRGIARITGEGASGLEGSTMQVGYQFGWAAAVDGKIGVGWTSPGLDTSHSRKYAPLKDKDGNQVVDENNDPVYTLTSEDKATVKGLLPQATAEISLTPAPGIEEIVAAEGEFDGDYKEVQIANVHGAAAGVVGPIQVRPFVRVITGNGDTVTTYGKVWTL